jgi:DNA-binding transcriptional LysR family regulator
MPSKANTVPKKSGGLGPVGGSGWKSAVEIRQLRAFLAVVEHGSLSAAAIALGVAQSTISEALASLDRAIGSRVILRKRGAHHVALTETGDALLPHARRILHELDAMHRSAAIATPEATATLNVTTNESVSTYLLAPALANLRKRWRNVHFSVTVATCPNVRADVAAGRCDLGMLLQGGTLESNAHHDMLHIAVLASGIPLVVFCGARHPFVLRSKRASASRDALTGYPIFIADAAGDFHEVIRRYLTADAMPGVRLEAVGSIDAVKRAVAAEDSALGILPSYCLTEDLKARRIVALDVKPVPPTVSLVSLLPTAQSGIHPALSELLHSLTQSS